MTPDITIPMKLLDHGVMLPKPATSGAAGMDLYASVADRITIEPGEHVVVPCGFAMALPDGWEAQVRPRSGLAAKNRVTILNSPGTIDADYRGEVGAVVINHGEAPFTVNRGDRIAQLVVARVPSVSVERVDELPETVRGEGGFGHTGT